MHRDPIVEEIHRIRQELLDEFGGDMDALAEDTNRRLFNGEYGDVKIVRYPPKPPVYTPKRDVADSETNDITLVEKAALPAAG
jgi:hypothetical protein